jgi:hypothetical protein
MSEETLSNGADTQVLENDNVQTLADSNLEQDETGLESDISESSTEAEAEPHKPPRGVQKRLDELTREKYEERRRAERAEALAERNAAMLEQMLRQQSQPQGNAGPPDPDEYSAGRFDPQYIEALTDYKARQAAQGFMEQQRQAQERQAQEAKAEQTRATIQRQEREFAKRFPDYNETRAFLLADERIASHQGIGAAIMDSDNAPGLLYHLGKNPDLAYRIADMDPVRAARELGRIEEQLSKPAAPKPVSQAPAPVGSMPSGGGSPPNTDLSKARDFKEWLAIREAGIKARG